MNPTDPTLLNTALHLLQTGIVANITKDGNEYLVIPADAQVFDMEKLRNAPRRIRQTVAFTRFESLCSYVNEFKTAGTKLFANTSTGELNVVLDYHTVAQASWRGHSAVFAPIIADAWRIWCAKDNQPFDQKSFALFLEENAIDILDPAPAEMLDIARNLSAKINVIFKKGLRLEDGTQQLQYEETIETKAGARGELRVPSIIALSISIWEGRPKRRLDARLRYAIKEGVLSFHYSLIRPQDSLRAEIDALTEEAAKQIGLVPLFGVAG